jgi:hypothetical protein
MMRRADSLRGGRSAFGVRRSAFGVWWLVVGGWWLIFVRGCASQFVLEVPFLNDGVVFRKKKK